MMELYQDINYINKPDFIKNVNEVKNIYEIIKDSFHLENLKDIEWFDICSGNFYWQNYFEPKITVADKELFNITKRFLEKITFIKQDIFSQLSPDFISVLKRADVITGIHPCLNLIDKIFELWENYGKKDSVLILVPCCCKKQPKTPYYYVLRKQMKKQRTLINRMLRIEFFKQKMGFSHSIEKGTDTFLVYKK